MGLLTPTFADKARGNGPVVEATHIEPPHEPLKGELFIPSTAPAVTPPVVPAAAFQPLKIAILGTAPSSRSLAPFNDPSWKIWACSPGNAHGQIPRADVWFEIHANLMDPDCIGYGKPYVEWLNQQTFPVYMIDNSLVPRATSYPWQLMVKRFGRYFFTSSFAWMAALAIHEGASEIGFYGVDMASRDEYVQQRSGGHFFIQTAINLGVKVTIPPQSDLAQPPPLYGIADANPHMRKWKARRIEIKQRVGQMQQEINQHNHNITYLQGADEDMDYGTSIWGGLADETELLKWEMSEKDKVISAQQTEIAVLKQKLEASHVA